MTHKAFWDILKQQLECDPPDYTQALSLMTEVKQVSRRSGRSARDRTGESKVKQVS